MRNKIIVRPLKTSELDNEEFYLKISSDWEERARKLRSRKWQKIKMHQKNGYV